MMVEADVKRYTSPAESRMMGIRRSCDYSAFRIVIARSVLCDEAMSAVGGSGIASSQRTLLATMLFKRNCLQKMNHLGRHDKGDHHRNPASAAANATAVMKFSTRN